MNIQRGRGGSATSCPLSEIPSVISTLKPHRVLWGKAAPTRTARSTVQACVESTAPASDPGGPPRRCPGAGGSAHAATHAGRPACRFLSPCCTTSTRGLSVSASPCSLHRNSASPAQRVQAWHRLHLVRLQHPFDPAPSLPAGHVHIESSACVLLPDGSVFNVARGSIQGVA